MIHFVSTCRMLARVVQMADVVYEDLLEPLRDLFSKDIGRDAASWSKVEPRSNLDHLHVQVSFEDFVGGGRCTLQIRMQADVSVLCQHHQGLSRLAAEATANEALDVRCIAGHRHESCSQAARADDMRRGTTREVAVLGKTNHTWLPGHCLTSCDLGCVGPPASWSSAIGVSFLELHETIGRSFVDVGETRVLNCDLVALWKGLTTSFASIVEGRLRKDVLNHVPKAVHVCRHRARLEATIILKSSF
mmetsp:Transcript_16189/g.35056  ORF Transcript_16189/g.35056 Transcript_16189/m.35056 type:complete len:247 (+) Transcript_16189:612-1352(+)